MCLVCDVFTKAEYTDHDIVCYKVLQHCDSFPKGDKIFLTPFMSTEVELGVEYEESYYWPESPSNDRKWFCIEIDSNYRREKKVHGGGYHMYEKLEDAIKMEQKLNERSFFSYVIAEAVIPKGTMIIRGATYDLFHFPSIVAKRVKYTKLL